MIVAVSVASPLRHCLTFGSVPDIRSIKENRPNVVQTSALTSADHDGFIFLYNIPKMHSTSADNF